ncbi:MAG: CreA family protein [Gammaproteobacteria bacterium]|nr:CreA family protein [Gammaproteobacteria bacterium]
MKCLWIRQCKLLILLACSCMHDLSIADEIGSVDTKFNLLSPDDSIKVAVVKDPKVDGVVCYLSRAQKGGYSGALGLAEDTSDASIDCRQVGPISLSPKIKPGESMFRERRSLIFKSLKIVRFCDIDNNALVYLAYSERVVEGSPKNSVSAVPIRPWLNQTAPIPECRY